MTRSKIITNHIIAEFEKIGNSEAISHHVLISDLLSVFPALSCREYAANRINKVLTNKGVKERFIKIKGKNEQWYIIRNQQIIEGENNEKV